VSTLLATKQRDGENVLSCTLFTDGGAEDTLVITVSNCERLLNWRIKLYKKRRVCSQYSFTLKVAACVRWYSKPAKLTNTCNKLTAYQQKLNQVNGTSRGKNQTVVT